MNFTRRFATGPLVGLIGAILASVAANAAAQTTYRVVDVGRLTSSGTYFSYAQGLNELNYVVGFTYVETGYRGFLYASALPSLLNMGDLPGGDDFSCAMAVNDLGVAVGSSSKAVLVDGVWKSLNRAFRWNARSGITDIGDDINPQGSSFATDINASGRVVGKAAASGTSTYSHRGFLWEPGGVVTYLPHLDPTGYPSTEPEAVTDTGLVVGASNGSNLGNHAFRWDADNGMSTLPGDTTLASRARDANEGGMVVGSGVVPDGLGSYKSIGFVLDGGLLTLIDLPRGAFAVRALAVNARGEVVGAVLWDSGTICLAPANVTPPNCYSDTSSDRAFVWTAGTGRVDLTSHVDPADPLAGSVYITSATDINDRGFIAANGYISGQSGQHAFLLIPTLVFSDDFDSADTSRWSAAVP